MKPKIAVVFNRMIVGGAEKSLIQFLRTLDTERYNITLFTYDDTSFYLNEVPDDINICFTKCTAIDARKHLIDDIRHFRVFSVIDGIYCRIMLHLSKNDYLKFMYTMRCLPKFSEKYACVIAYKFNYEDTAIALYRFEETKRCAWQHGTVNSKLGFQDKLTARYGAKLQAIFCVSNQAKENLDIAYPQFSNKTSVIHNIIRPQDIIEKSKQPMEFAFKKRSLLTVGRLCKDKGQQMIPATVRLLLDSGYNVYWYLVGDGSLRDEIELEIEKYKVADHVILLGTILNPYPYIRNCDLYVQTSYSEGWCLTIQEAKILQKPIVTTNLPVMLEQLNSGENGLIVDEITPEALFEGIRTLLEHPELQEKFINNLRTETYDNTNELQKLYDFIES